MPTISKPPSECRRAQANCSGPGHDVVTLCIGQPNFQTPDHIIEAGRKALADGHHGYTLANGILPLREVVVADL